MPKRRKNTQRLALGHGGTRFHGALQGIDIELTAGPAAALGAAGRRFAEEGPVKNPAYVEGCRDEQRTNQEILNFDGSKGEQKHN